MDEAGPPSHWKDQVAERPGSRLFGIAAPGLVGGSPFTRLATGRENRCRNAFLLRMMKRARLRRIFDLLFCCLIEMEMLL
ncbi:MAG: hypothetical protein CMK06_08895 [Ponticaulis sp.]|nr:hypothetical protein [Ponticaulis sp.]